MSLRNLVEDQCGTANSLVQLSSHFVQDRALKDQGLLHPFQHENFPNENEQAPQFMDNAPSFRMDNLLSEMRDLEASGLAKSLPAPEPYASMIPIQTNENVSDWANQYIESGSKFADIEDKPFQQSIWSNDMQNEIPNPISKPNDRDVNLNSAWVDTFYKEPIPQAVAPVYSSIPPNFSFETSELQYVAGQVADSMNDRQFSHSKFLKFMNQVSEGQVHINNGEIIAENVPQEDSTFSQWASLPNMGTTTIETPVNREKEKSFADWGKTTETASVIGAAPDVETSEIKNENVASEDQYSKELWSKLTERWEQLNLGNQDPWDSELNKFVSSLDTYNFAEENPMADKLNALEEGKKKLAEGDLPSAVLCFEAAVQQDSNIVEGWLLLGKTQAENEHDEQAIAALKTCLKLDPENLEALKELAVCYTNENYQYQACSTLQKWLAYNPRYKDIVETLSEDEEDPAVTSILTMKCFNKVLNMYLKAVQRYPSAEEADADIQNGLGVLLTLNNDYDKAVDCFETAVKIRPDDSRLWNRIGATLANGQKPERALEAYRQALALSPGFIRARYNLGITCVHLKMYQQAVEYLLIALNQQIAGRGIHGEKSRKMSESIWTTLRLALSLSDRRDLLPLVEKRKLNELSKEFNISKEDFATSKDV